MRILCIDTGTNKSGCVLMDNDVIEYAKIITNNLLADCIERTIIGLPLDLCIVEMITIFGGRRRSSHIAESIIIIGMVMQICEDYNIPYQRVSRQQVISYFLRKDKSGADAKIIKVMREKLGFDIKQRHPLLKYDLWQAYALYQYAKEHEFKNWYVPQLDIAKNNMTPEQRKEKQKKFLINDTKQKKRGIEKNQSALDKLNS